MTWYEAAWDYGKEVVGEALDFASENVDLISAGVSGASAYYGYQQQQDAIAAQEAATAQALAMQDAQIQAELNAAKLTAPVEQASINLLANTQKVAGSVNDFLFEKNVADTENVGLGVPDYEKALGIV